MDRRDDEDVRLAALMAYWETATEALMRAGLSRDRAMTVAWEGMKMRLEGKLDPRRN